MPNSDMSFVERVFSIIDDLESENVHSPASIAQNIGAIGTYCGYEYFTITRLPQPKLRLGPAMVIKHWPDNWLGYYDRSAYFQYDPVGRFCFEALDPFLWSDARYAADDVMAARVMHEAAEHGLRHGFCVPIYGLAGFRAVASYAGERPELTSHRRKSLHLLSIAAYEWSERQARACRKINGPLLSPREKDVMIWMALGETKAQVAARLGISALTVRTHLDRARTKLGAVNTVNAVVEALRLREIRI